MGVEGFTVGCLVIPALPLACELIDRPELRGRAVAVAHPEEPLIWAISAAARERGVVGGQQVRHALSLCPNLDVIEGRPRRYAEIMDELHDRLHEIVYAIEPAGEGLVYLGLNGLEARHSSLRALSATLLGRTSRQLRPQLGVACQRFTALVAAHQARPRQFVTVAANAARDYLAPHSIELLPISFEILDRLTLLGLTTLGGIAALPRHALVAEFGGTAGEALWRMATGNDTGDVHPSLQDEHLEKYLFLESPIVTRDHLLVAIEHLINDVCRSPQFSGRATRQVRLSLGTDRSGLTQKTLNFHEPVSDAHTLWLLVKSALGGVQLPGAVVEVRLALMGLAMAHGWQVQLPVTNGGRDEFLEEGLRKLHVQYGHCPVSRVVALDPDNRVPEHRWALIDRTP